MCACMCTLQFCACVWVCVCVRVCVCAGPRVRRVTWPVTGDVNAAAAFVRGNRTEGFTRKEVACCWRGALKLELLSGGRLGKLSIPRVSILEHKPLRKLFWHCTPYVHVLECCLCSYMMISSCCSIEKHQLILMIPTPFSPGATYNKRDVIMILIGILHNIIFFT